MILDLRKRILIVGGGLIGVIALFVLLYMFFFRTSPSAEEEIVPVSAIPVNQVSNPPVIVDGVVVSPARVPIVFPKASVEQYALQRARMFVERFTTFSNQNENQHITDVRSLLTESMAQWVETQNVPQGDVFEGVVTRVLATSIEQFDGDTATVLVDAQVTNQGQSGKTVTQKSGRVNLVQEDEQWFVDSFFWL